jgi:hypothetical protein
MATIPQIIALGRMTALALIAGSATGCGPKYNFEGSWLGRRSMKVNAGTPSYEALTLQTVKLFIHSNGRFELQDMGERKEGTISVQGEKAVLVITKIEGVDIRNQPKETQDSVGPIDLTSLDGKTIRYDDPKAFDPTPVELTRGATTDPARP